MPELLDMENPTSADYLDFFKTEMGIHDFGTDFMSSFAQSTPIQFFANQAKILAP